MSPPFVLTSGQDYPELRKPILRWVVSVATLGPLSLCLWLRPFRVAVEGRSMAPTLEPGDFLLATVRGPVSRGSLVVMEHPLRPDFEMVKRAVAIPGDRAGGRVLGRREYWVVGDSAQESSDSRALGAIDADAIRGVVRARYWPPSRIRLF